MLSVINVAGIPSCCSSQTVRREPCRKGRVSSANTSIFFPAETAARMTPTAVTSQGRRATNWGSAAKHHRADSLRYVLITVARDISLLVWQSGLVDHDHARLGPFNGLYHDGGRLPF